MFDILTQFFLFGFIRLSEDNHIWQFLSRYPLYKLDINLLWRYITIDKDKDLFQVFSLGEIFYNHLFKPMSFFFANFRISIPWEISQICLCLLPFCILYHYIKKVHQLCLTRFRWCLDKSFSLAQCIDQARLSNITPPDKCKFCSIRVRTVF